MPQVLHQDLNAELKANLDLLEENLTCMTDFSIKLSLAELATEKHLGLPRGAADLGEALDCTNDQCTKVCSEIEKIMKMPANAIKTQAIAIDSKNELLKKKCYELIKLGANPNTFNSTGNTYIHLVAVYFTDLLANQIKETNLDINLKNKQGLTPLQYLYKFGTQMEINSSHIASLLNIDSDRLSVGSNPVFIDKGMKLIALGVDSSDCDGKGTSFLYYLTKTALKASSDKLLVDICRMLYSDKNIIKYGEVISKRAHEEEMKKYPIGDSTSSRIYHEENDAMVLLYKSLGFWAKKVIKAVNNPTPDAIQMPNSPNTLNSSAD